ncbi:DUF368 domain-containing protein [Halodesulfurarchaeum sp. HSR-GB]|uniref:DUF368 domain-containing protein n=1 Tax=Halodesulfurarchaeum sp. HSR-GB TaxID=3074077 RepID=UPI00285D7F38|nr:DUF368 domain-containing protein [Halodesulfurarchaeum sp. HSR-GB]MDR5657398.1 DUF368 domain-containing protein [Halodesulfurarchaeum sp. HSR-GB]
MAAQDWLAVYLKGFAMGTADAIPGVSGGTIALIAGIYDRLVTAIAGLDVEGGLALLGALLGSHEAQGRREAVDHVVELDLHFLAVLGIGIVTAAVTAANVIHLAVGSYPGPTYAFFFGLIAASVVVLREAMAIDTPRGIAIAVTGFAVAWVLTGVTSTSIGDGLLLVFLSGAVAICAMILPGISGSLILLALGQYERIVGTVRELTTALVGGGDLLGPATVLAVFALGAGLGVLAFARVVAWALETDRSATLTFLVALMAGALRAPGSEIIAATETWTPGATAALMGMGILGGGLVLVLDRVTAGVEY